MTYHEIKTHSKHYFKVVSLAFIILSITSCEEVIDIDTNTAEPQLVIEANFSDIGERQYVRISETVPVSDQTKFIGVANADIEISNQNGISYKYIEEEPGVYYRLLRGIPNSLYTLKVTVGGKTYTAVSKMPKKVALDSLSITEISFLDEKRKYIQLHYKDPVDEVNQYNFVIDINEKRSNSYYVERDRFNNGKNVTNIVFTNEPEIKSGDDIKLNFQNIDLNIYRYFFSITQIGGNGGPPVSPANPNSNFDNGALGYFNAHTSERRTFKVN